MQGSPSNHTNESPKGHKESPLGHLTRNISSHDTNMMLVAIISLLLVILFVLLLHIYAKWFLAHQRRVARTRRTTRMSSSASSHLITNHNIHYTIDIDTSDISSSPAKGLDKSTISKIPLFIYEKRLEEEEEENEEHNRKCSDDLGGLLQCVICLSFFEENEVCRRLKKCGHCFHVDCIDMWLHSHSNCPICRAPVVVILDNHDPVMTATTTTRGGEATTEVVEMNGSDEIIHVTDVSSDSHRNGNNDIDVVENSRASSSSTTSSLATSFKRMLSRNRSEHKVFPSSDATLVNP